MRLRLPLHRPSLFLALASAAAFATAAGPTPTPTPRPKLSGGFGRTPVPGAPAVEAPTSDVVRAAASARGRKEPKTVAITNETLVKDPNKGRLSTSQARPAPTPARALVPASASGSSQAGPLAGTPPPASGLPAAGAAERASSSSSSTAPSPGASPAPAEDEATWRERARAARRRVEELKAEITTLEADSKQLENDFYRWDDGQYRDRVIKPAWDKKREDLETRRRQLVDAEAELADLPEKARKAGALPGWLRE